MKRCALLCVAALASGACGEPQSGSDAGSPSAAFSVASMAQAAADMAKQRRRQLLQAELRREVSAVREEDLSARHVEVRRAAARALARARKDAARAPLLRLLGDEDARVVTWAAYGLGDHCAKHREANVSALVVAAARVSAPPVAATGSMKLRGPIDAILRAIGRCGATRSETILVGWASRRGSHMAAALEALGDVARHNKTLREDTVVALLQLASGDALHAPEPLALYPLGRSERLPASTVAHARDIAAKRLRDGGDAKPYAARTLGRCGEEAVAQLLAVVSNTADHDAVTRSEALRGLLRMGDRGQRALGKAVQMLAPADAAASLVNADFGVLLLAVQSLTRIREARSALEKMARMVPAADASEADKRRLSWLRCAAAQLLVERNYHDLRVRRCDLSVPAEAKDPISASIGARALVAAIGVDGARIRGARLKAWTLYAEGGDTRARQAALKLLDDHDEVRTAPQVLAKALKASDAGVVAAAAEVLTKHPRRAFKRGRGGEVVDDAVVAALLHALKGEGPAADVEALGAVIDASAALSLGSALPSIQQHCASAYDTVVEHADKALVRLSGAGARCASKRASLPPVAELETLLTKPLWLLFDTPVGALRMQLDPDFAPVAVTRTKQLVEAGYFDDMVAHRVVPGFVSQFGSPTGDGYGGAPGRPPIPCETSPLSYRRWGVGVALAGRDTGSSQLFVTHAAYPHLDGGYALLGSASGPWDALVDGDRIRKATVVAAEP